MREIKFRAWDKEESEFINIKSFGFFENGEVWYVQAIDESENEIDPPYFTDRDDLVLTQYTGLKDKNGKEIYDGDIVKISNHPFEGSMQINGIYEVGYNEQLELCCGSLLLFRNKHYAEVIGNKFENPELFAELR